MTEIMVQRLKDRIEQLEDVLGVGKPMTERLALSFGIDIELGVFLGMLYRRQFVTREGLYTVMYEGRPECDWPEPKVLDIHLCRLRKVLRTHGATVVTKWGAGWHMPADSKAIIRERLEAHQIELSTIADRNIADRRRAFLDGY